MKSNASRLGCRWVLGAIFLLVLLTGSGVTVLADSSLVFLDEEPLACSLGDSTSLIQVTMMNSGQAVAGLQFSVETLQDAEGALVGDEVIHVQADADSMEGFAVATFALTFSYSDRGDLSPGTYSGFLVAAAPGAAPAHRPFTLEVPEEEPGTSLADLVPQDKTVTITVTNGGWPLILGGRAREERRDVILYRSGVDTLDLSGIPPAVAVLQTEGGDSATVTLAFPDGAVSSEELPAALTVSDVTRPGKYTGELHLTPMDAEGGQTITVTALVQDHWLWPFLIIGIGVLLAYFVSLWMERTGPAELVREDLRDTRDAITETEATSAGGDPDYKIGDSAERWAEDIEETLRHGDVDTARQDLGKLDDRLEEFFVLRFWTSSLKTRYDGLRTSMDVAGETSYPVAFSIGQELLSGHQIWDAPYVNTNLQAESKAVAEGDSLLEQFGWVYDFYRKVQQEIERLAKKTGDHEASLPQFRRELREIHDALWNATSEEELKGKPDGILVRLNKVWMGLDRLPVPEPVRAEGLLAPLSWEPLSWKRSAYERPSREQWDRKERSLWEKLKTYLGARPALKLVNGGVLAVTLILAIVSGLAVLYPGGIFGTWDDYLKALLWGSVGQQLATYVGNLAKVAKVRVAP